ncbi:hydrogenase accessory protein HypB [Paraburkholderia xenovorans LB400]|uniref:Hydrogenase maturation factor HypB n=1 Tax=Paraburkholderia xenovorans (strain LB400) TaxID=266265 RepID=Q13HK5_PARXL|nr:hydrogenase nickel incorporation protein HypB [Paraburkholderia xenovorans]ABE36434.1 Hydrogenase accessory protein HypB [Paraburkholderia xenovorans LB400]AIP34385.1 hydrogenase accessory protein HypB [Paraburkholderia xenovorans LB400]
MCVVCGCGTGADPETVHADDEEAGTSHVAPTSLNGELHYGAGVARLSVPGMSEARAIRIETDVLDENRRHANRNRAHFASHRVTALNLVSSPGSGKTTLLCASIEALKIRRPGFAVAVIEGDQQTSVDAERIRATGAPAIQVNTGRGCHLDAQMVGEAFAHLDLHTAAHHARHAGAMLFIENVGNLVCPALWDLGEAAKVVVLSVTEGDDKPLKYPDMFAAATLMIINKIDLLPYVSFDVTRCIEYARQVNPSIDVLRVSATRGDGMDDWLGWLLPPRVEPRFRTWKASSQRRTVLQRVR